MDVTRDVLRSETTHIIVDQVGEIHQGIELVERTAEMSALCQQFTCANNAMI